MGAFFVYIVKSAVCLAVFYLFYRLLLSRETFHRFNRIALLGILILSCAIPFVEVEIVGIHEDIRKVVVTGIEMFRKLLDEAQPGDNIGALLRGVQRDEIQRGQVLCKPGSITPHHKFTAQVYVLTKDEGGRHTPFFNNYRPQFYFRTTDVTGVCELPAGTEMCMPGDNVEMTVELIHNVAMEQGLRFAIREGGRTVGSGAVATIIE